MLLRVVFCIWCAEIIEEVKLASLSMREDSKKARKIGGLIVCMYTSRCLCVILFYLGWKHRPFEASIAIPLVDSGSDGLWKREQAALRGSETKYVLELEAF